MQTRLQTMKTFFTKRPVRALAATAAVAVAAALTTAALAQPHHGGMGGGMMSLHPQQMERVLDSVNASAEQRAQIKQIAQSAMADLKLQREAGRALMAQSQALLAQPTIDARAAEALRQQMLAQHDQASKRTLQAVLAASQVLTPEQRKTLSDRFSQRRALMERQRTERESLDRPLSR